MITIVDYGVGNLASITNMLKKAGVESSIASSSESIAAATKLILPGVGAFDTCANKLAESGLLLTLNKKVLEEKIPVLGVCVGMQLMTESSEEGVMPGLGWINGRIVKFNADRMNGRCKIPHMGWSEVRINKKSELFAEMPQEARFYFVHSYHPTLTNTEDTLLFASYGYEFAAGIERGNIYGVQFHPEKSHRFGLTLLHNFAKLGQG